MNMNDSVSILFHSKDVPISYKQDEVDQYFWRDMRIHLQKNPDYREEKKVFRKEKGISIEQSTFDFVIWIIALIPLIPI